MMHLIWMMSLCSMEDLFGFFSGQSLCRRIIKEAETDDTFGLDDVTVFSRDIGGIAD